MNEQDIILSFIQGLPKPVYETVSLILVGLIILYNVFSIIEKINSKSAMLEKLLTNDSYKSFMRFMAIFSPKIRNLLSTRNESGEVITKEEKSIVAPTVEEFPFQINNNLNPQIQKYGCYFMALLWLFGKDKIKNVKDVNEYYDRCVINGSLKTDCTVMDAGAIATELTGIKHTVRYDNKITTNFINDSTKVILRFYNKSTNYTHFVAGAWDAARNAYRVERDSIPDSNTVANGQLADLRVITRQY